MWLALAIVVGFLVSAASLTIRFVAYRRAVYRMQLVANDLSLGPDLIAKGRYAEAERVYSRAISTAVNDSAMGPDYMLCPFGKDALSSSWEAPFGVLSVLFRHLFGSGERLRLTNCYACNGCCGIGGPGGHLHFWWAGGASTSSRILHRRDVHGGRRAAVRRQTKRGVAKMVTEG